ncbi:MAG: TRAM domain-containing protein [Oscillospiraceae bacterium]
MEQLAKNQLHTAEITGYTSEGAGVCHIAGRAVFVKGALVGETWQVRILKVTSAAVYGKAEQCLSLPLRARAALPCLPHLRRLQPAAHGLRRAAAHEARACQRCAHTYRRRFDTGAGYHRHGIPALLSQ